MLENKKSILLSIDAATVTAWKLYQKYRRRLEMEEFVCF